MSFAKAKLQRFNEKKDCTPSPARYNVAKITGKFTKKTGSPPASEAGSVHSTPCFQTPTVPKKKKFMGLGSFKNKSMEQEELREKIVECNNKDLYIKDLTDQVEELTGKIAVLEQDKAKLAEEILEIRREQSEEIGGLLAKHAKEYASLVANVKGLTHNLAQIRRQCENLKNEHCGELTNLLGYINKFEALHAQALKESQDQIVSKHLEEISCLKKDFNSEIKTVADKLEEMNKEEIKNYKRMLDENEAKIKLLEENLKEINLLSEIQMREKIEEIEVGWKMKLEAKEKESEAILKECQEISEYNIIQSELEKNQLKNQLAEQQSSYDEITKKCQSLEVEITDLKTEKHAYELSIHTFRDTIEVLKKRLIDSDRDVEQLKEELARCEERILEGENKCSELTNQLSEREVANEELEMQYESTSKIMQNQVRAMEKSLLEKVEALKLELKRNNDKILLNEVLEQHHQQQSLIVQAQETIVRSNVTIEKLEKQLNESKRKLEEEMEEAAEIRKKYIEQSGKFDELSLRFEQLLKDSERARGRIEELEKLTGKKSVSDHQNHKTSELFQKNIDLEASNGRLAKALEKLKKEMEELRKAAKKTKSFDKENIPSPKCLSPAPLKDKN